MKGSTPIAPPVRHHDCCSYVVRLVPVLNLAALKARPRQDNQLLMWYCLRAVDTTGRGVLDHEQAVQALKSFFGYQRQTCYKHLQAGDGTYWCRHTTRKGKVIIILYGLLRVAQHLEADIGGRERFIDLPASELPPSGQVQARRAILYNTGAYKPSSAPVNHPISRESLKEKTGIEPRQQRRYDGILEAQGPVRKATFGFYRDRQTGKLRKLVRLVQTDRGLVLTHQIPNRYWTLCPGGSRGMLPTVARILTVGDQFFTRGEANSTTDRHRRYYRDIKSFIRAAVRGNTIEGFHPHWANDSQYILETV